jgi:hypothetical protein
MNTILPNNIDQKMLQVNFAKQYLRTTVQDPAGKVIRIFAKQHSPADPDAEGNKKPPPFLMRVS